MGINKAGQTFRRLLRHLWQPVRTRWMSVFLGLDVETMITERMI